MRQQRIIGEYTGDEKGPLLIIFGGMHGNEPAGVKALDLIFKMVEVEPITNPNFKFKGKLLGLRGNVRALANQQRFLEKDLNRQWTPNNVAKVEAADFENLDAEEREIRENLFIIERTIAQYDPQEVVVLDIHTTTAYGGIFTIATDDPESLAIAKELHAPVILGLLKGVQGTSLHYFCTKNFDRKVTPVCFEAGQHDEPLSTNRAIAAIINCMRTIGCVQAQDVENRHDSLLIEYSNGLPNVSELVMVHSIKVGDNFEMRPGYKNFDVVKKGDVVAKDKNGEIKIVEDGMLLMPLYQKKGNDGFFLIRKNETI